MEQANIVRPYHLLADFPKKLKI